MSLTNEPPPWVHRRIHPATRVVCRCASLSLANYLVWAARQYCAKLLFGVQTQARERHTDRHGRVETLGLTISQGGEAARVTRRLWSWAMLCYAFSVFSHRTKEHAQLS
jgi:hypothetical protein